MLGSPDWALEVVSEYSAQKDTRDLIAKYQQAGIPEYWLIDAPGEEIDFQLMIRGKKGDTAAPQAGWHQSQVFGRRFRLDRKPHPLGTWIYTLHVKP